MILCWSAAWAAARPWAEERPTPCWSAHAGRSERAVAEVRAETLHYEETPRAVVGGLEREQPQVQVRPSGRGWEAEAVQQRWTPRPPSARPYLP